VSEHGLTGWLGERPLGGVRRGGALIWLLFIVFPLINAIGNGGPAMQHGLTIAGASAFVAAYMALVLTWRQRRRFMSPALLFAVLVSVATALTLGDRPGWAFLFTYCAACSALASPPRLAFLGVALCTALAGGTTLVAGGSGGPALGFVASTAGIGLLMLLFRDLRTRNDELVRARAELARLAVSAERERFARDLHDLLGHSLSVIALKAELAGRLLPGHPDQAAREITEVEGVARQALSEVRDAVSGYRRPTLDGELAGARMALSAAGIEAEIERPAATIDPSVEAVFGWAVREGATNVIRHSGASHCRVSVNAGSAETALEMLDDGPGGRRANGVGGHGLEGLTERVHELGGRVEAGAREGGGYRLAVRVPATHS
jgi:two-component system sensor histidine kinase DesK